jgi:hypothetical protein
MSCIYKENLKDAQATGRFYTSRFKGDACVISKRLTFALLYTQRKFDSKCTYTATSPAQRTPFPQFPSAVKFVHTQSQEADIDNLRSFSRTARLSSGLQVLQWGYDTIYMFFQYFICRPSDSTVSEDAGIAHGTVATLVLAARRSNRSASSHPHSARSHPHSARSHPLSARSHPQPAARSHSLADGSHPHSARYHPLSTRSHPHSARSHPFSARSIPHSARSLPHLASLG